MTRVIVFVDRNGAELQPLTAECPVALLPIAAKPLLIHCLEDLAMAGLSAVTLVLSSHADEIKTTLGSGARWGLTIEYVLSRGEESPADLLQRLEPATGPMLILRGDVLRSPCLRDFLVKVPPDSDRSAELTLGNRRAAVLRVAPGFAADDVNAVGWPPPDDERTSPSSVDCPAGAWYPLSDLANFHAANLDAAAGRIQGLLLPGRQTAIGLRVGRQSKVSPRSVRRGVALIGSNCRVDSGAVFEGVVVVSDNVLIDSEAEIQDSVILPNTYIGQLVHIRNAIVRGADLIRVDTGAQLQVSDTFLIADLGADGTAEYLAQPLNKVIGFLLFLASLPLWVSALVLATARNSRHPIRRKILRGNRIELNTFGIRTRRNFTTWEFACKAPILRYLPRLLAVIQGDLKLIGTLPITEQQAAERIDDWQRAADRAPSGLIGPSQLLLPPDATPEDVILSDALYARQRNFTKDLSLLAIGFRHLFCRRSWTNR